MDGFFFKVILVEYSCFTSAVISAGQPELKLHVYDISPLFFDFLPLLIHHRALSKVPYAMQ